MKKHLSGMVAVLLCITLAACSRNDVPENSYDSAVSSANSTTNCETSSVDESTQSTAQENEDQNSREPESTSEAAFNTGTYPDGSTPKLSGIKLKLTVNDTDEVIIAMYDNTAANALVERLPLTDLSFYDLSGCEKPIQRLDEPISLEDETPGYDPIAGEMAIYRPWGNFTIFYDEFRYSDELVPLGIVESGLDIIAAQTEDFSGILERLAAN